MPVNLDGWQVTTIICSLIGAALVALFRYFPPRHVIEAEEKRPRVIGCEAGQHVSRLHDRTDSMKDTLAKVSEAVVRLTAVQESLAINEARRETESREFHKATFSNFERTHTNQQEIKHTIESEMKNLLQGLRTA